MKYVKLRNVLNSIDTVNGHCEYCDQETILISIVDDYYKCTNCGEDTRQYVNGSIRYLKLREMDKEFLKQNG